MKDQKTKDVGARPENAGLNAILELGTYEASRFYSLLVLVLVC